MSLPESPFLSARPPQASAEKAPAAVDWNPAAAGVDNIGEIFAGASKLDPVLDAEYLFELDPGNEKYRGMMKPRLNVALFMLELDDVPLFLRSAG